MSEALLKQLVSDNRVKTRTVFKWRDPNKPLETFECVGIHPRFIVSMERVAFEDALRRGEPTTYSHSEVHLTDMSPFAVARRKAAMSRDPEPQDRVLRPGA